MSGLRWYVPVLIAACFSIALMTADPGDSTAAAEQTQTVVVTDKENQTKVKLSKGDTLELKLQANPTTGFLWVVAKNKEEQLKQQGKTEFLKGDKKVIGAPTTQIYRFRAEKAGSSELELHYKRPFEKGKEPAKTFKVTVEIGG
jgi:inhibitor of cysteine peptidase